MIDPREYDEFERSLMEHDICSKVRRMSNSDLWAMYMQIRDEEDDNWRQQEEMEQQMMENWG